VCFSPQADLVGGVVITMIGVDAVRHVRQRRELTALAWIPLLLGAHQFIEALTWLWLQGHIARGIGHLALWAYLLIALVVLPVSVPLAVIALEPTKWRKLMMVPFAAIGAVTATVLFAAMAGGPVGVRLAPYHLAYSVRLHDGFLITAVYGIAVCGPLLLSGYRHVAVSASSTSPPSSSSPASPPPGSPPSGAGGRPCPAAPSRCIAATRGLTATTPGPGLTASYPTGERASRTGIARPPAFHGRPHACPRPQIDHRA
jgi:hypothetical protein